MKSPQVCPEGTQPGKAREGISSPSQTPEHRRRMKQGRTVDTATSQVPLQTRQALQNGDSQGPWASGTPCGKGQLSPQGLMGRACSVSLPRACLLHLPYPQSSWCTQEGPRALSTTANLLGLKKQLSPAWELQDIPSLPQPRCKPTVPAS